MSYRVAGVQHYAVGSHDFPGSPGPLVCRICSYTDDGVPARAVVWPCPPVLGAQRLAARRRGSGRRSAAAGVPAEQQIIARAGLPERVEAQLLAHMAARRQDMEAALEQEAQLLLGQARMLARADGVG